MPNANEVAEIRCNGQSYTNWKTVHVRRDFGNAVSVFTFSAVEPTDLGQGWGALRLKPFDQVQVLLAGQPVINGSITARTTSFDAGSHEVVVQGKSKTDAATMASVPIQPGAYNGSWEQITRRLLAPHGIGLVLANPPPGHDMPLQGVYPQFGETCHEMFERLARMRGMFLTDDEKGNLVAGQYSSNVSPIAELQEGRNIKSAVVTLNNENAWGKLTMVGQTPGNDQNWPPRDYSVTATNAAMPSNLVRTAIAEHPDSVEGLKMRANFEASHSLWNQVNATIVVQGWLKDDGTLWKVEPTQYITVYSPMAFPNESNSMVLGVQSIVYSQDSENGTTATLELKLPGALSSLASPFPDGGQGNIVDSPKAAPAQPDPSDVS